MDETISIVLFSGTDDKLQAAATSPLARPPWVSRWKIFLQYWGLNAFPGRRDRLRSRLVARSRRGGQGFHRGAAKAGQASWTQTLRMAKELGEVDIQACSASMEILKLKQSDLDSLVDGVEGVAAFYINAGEGQIVFI